MSYLDPSLPRDIFGWHSPRLGIWMPIARYGNWGRPLVLIPTAGGDFLEAERMYLIKSVEWLIQAGRVQIFAIDSINPHSWMNQHISVPEKARRQALYSHYIEDEVVPHIRNTVQNPGARIGITGASFGGFYAATAFFRRPDLFDTLLAMSGFYDLTSRFTHGHFDDNVYYHNPLSFIPNMSDHGTLETLRHASSINILTGKGQWETPHESWRLSDALWKKGIPHNLDMWGEDMKHDWPTWRQMLPYYLGERLNWW